MDICPHYGNINLKDAQFCFYCGKSIGSSESNYQPAAGEPPFSGTKVIPKYMGFWIRFAAFLVDAAILWVARFPVVLIFWAINDDFSIWGGWKRGTSNIGMNILYTSIALGTWFAYFIIMDVPYQATLGKMLFKLKVVGTDLEKITYKTATLRELSKILSWIICLLGFIWAGFDSKKQAWHDKIAKTYVIH